MLDECGDLSFSFGGKNGSCTTLDRVGSAVELGGVASIPEGVKRDLFAGGCREDQSLGDHGVGAAHAGEATIFGE